MAQLRQTHPDIEVVLKVGNRNTIISALEDRAIDLAIMGRPSILVPLPHAIDDHQSYNARSLSDCGAAVFLRQAQMSSEALVKTLRGYMAYPQRLLSMAEAAIAAANPNATGLVCDTCEELIHGH